MQFSLPKVCLIFPAIIIIIHCKNITINFLLEDVSIRGYTDLNFTPPYLYITFNCAYVYIDQRVLRVTNGKSTDEFSFGKNGAHSYWLRAEQQTQVRQLENFVEKRKNLWIFYNFMSSSLCVRLYLIWLQVRQKAPLVVATLVGYARSSQERRRPPAVLLYYHIEERMRVTPVQSSVKRHPRKTCIVHPRKTFRHKDERRDATSVFNVNACIAWCVRISVVARRVERPATRVKYFQ